MNEKILVVDDEKDIRKLLTDFFQLQGYQVYTARNGQEALDKISVNPDIILLDINMPQMDGMEVCKKIRNYVTCPILFLTARIQEQDQINGLMIGGHDCCHGFLLCALLADGSDFFRLPPDPE